MQTYEIIVRNRDVIPNSTDMTLVRTSVGIDQVHVLFDNDEWLDFPITITFAQGNDILRSQTLVIRELADTTEWVAESYATIPLEVVEHVGPIRVTLQGTDSNGRHIITAKGSPISVVEAGDVVIGDAPDDAPTVSQWQQAYADAMNAASQATSAASTLQSRIDAIVAEAQSSIAEMIPSGPSPATSESLGSIIVGSGLRIDEEGVLDVTSVTGITQTQASQIRNLARLASYCFDTEFDSSGTLKDTAKAKSSALPLATISTPGTVMADGISTTVDSSGMLHFVGGLVHEWNGTTLTVTSGNGTSSADLRGPIAEITDVSASVDGEVGTPSVTVTSGVTSGGVSLDFTFSCLKGEKGDRGPQGPSGYVLTDDDIETISDEILSRYELIDIERF